MGQLQLSRYSWSSTNQNVGGQITKLLTLTLGVRMCVFEFLMEHIGSL